jgi:DNA-binding LacI/PurR family transcriptional regulator
MLYESVFEQLRQDIEKGLYPVGSKLPLMADLCEKFSVSSITVRKALDMLRKEGYIDRQPRIGTTVISTNPNSSPQAGGLPLIAFILTGFDDAFGTKIVESALDAARNKANVIMQFTKGDEALEDAAIDSAVNAGAQGLILMPSSSAFIPNRVLELVSRGFPVTTIDRDFQGVPITTVNSDNMQGAQDATERLIALGHRHIALITSHSHVTSNYDRRSGWALAYARDNIVMDEELRVQSISFPIDKVKREKAIAQNVKELESFISRHPEVTAYLVGEYGIALLLRTALIRLGKKIPKDASIICFDYPDTQYDDNMPQFTCVAQDQQRIGSSAVRETLSQIRSGAAAKKIVIPTRLLEGDSTARVA